MRPIFDTNTHSDNNYCRPLRESLSPKRPSSGEGKSSLPAVAATAAAEPGKRASSRRRTTCKKTRAGSTLRHQATGPSPGHIQSLSTLLGAVDDVLCSAWSQLWRQQEERPANVRFFPLPPGTLWAQVKVLTAPTGQWISSPVEHRPANEYNT